MYCNWGKRLFDIIFACTLLLLLSPILFIICILVRLFLGSPILFIQSRPGLDEKPFYLYKFRSMVDVRDKKNILLSDAQRLTTFGRFLRNLSLDELPEILNVLKGDMSFVGPRPLLMEYLAHYSTEQRLRHTIKPGITGWAQINGRNTLSWKKKFELDVWYVKHYSFLIDLKIIFKTIVKTIKREGIHADGHATMTRFDIEPKEKNLS
jgi:sugar transferase EpsL